MLPARAPRLLFIFITLFLDVLGFSLLIPVAPRLIAKVQGLNFEGEEGKTAFAVGMLAGLYALMQFIFAPILGSLSDRFGRRPVILISLLGSGIDYFAMAFAPTLTWLFITRAINGISGANMTACAAYIADVTPPEKRSASFGLIGAAFGLGFIIGPLAGGVLGDPSTNIPLIGAGDIHYPFIAAGTLTLCNWLYGCFVLPESHPKERRRAFSLRQSNPLGAFAWLARHRLVATLASTLFLVNVAQFSLHATWVLSMSARFQWGPRMVGWSLFVVGVCAAIVQGGLSRKIIPKVGERACLVGGLVIGVLAFLGYALATESWMIFAVIVAASIGGVAAPAAQGIISKAVDPSEQGLLQGALTGLNSIAGMAGYLGGTVAFGYFTSAEAAISLPRDGASAPFLISAALSLASLAPVLLVWGVMPTSVRADASETESGPRRSS